MSPGTSWALLCAAGLLEAVWASALKSSAGFSKLWPSIAAITGAAASFTLLSLALRSIPLSTGYPVWVGLGAAGAVAVSILRHGEQISATELLSIALILAGTAGLRSTAP